MIHISDLHMHIKPSDNEPTLTRLDSIVKTYPDDIIIVTGDITDDGHPDQYENAKNVPGLKVPGNHDYGAAGNFYNRYKAELFDSTFGTNYAGDNDPQVDVIEGVRFIGLDSNLETDHPFDFACGEIGRKQLKALKGILNGPSMPTVVYMHHHPFVRNDPFMELRDAREFIRIIYGRVDVLLFGHRHIEGLWKDTCGIKIIHAAPRLSDVSHVFRITIEYGCVNGEYVRI